MCPSAARLGETAADPRVSLGQLHGDLVTNSALLNAVGLQGLDACTVKPAQGSVVWILRLSALHLLGRFGKIRSGKSIFP